MASQIYHVYRRHRACSKIRDIARDLSFRRPPNPRSLPIHPPPSTPSSPLPFSPLTLPASPSLALFWADVFAVPQHTEVSFTAQPCCGQGWSGTGVRCGQSRRRLHHHSCTRWSMAWSVAASGRRPGRLAWSPWVVASPGHLTCSTAWSPHLVALGGRFTWSPSLFNGLVASLDRLGWSLHLVTFPG